MRRISSALAVLVVCSLAMPARGEGIPGLPCEFRVKVRERCGDYGCVVAGEMDPDLIDPGTKGQCQPCAHDWECGGVKCDRLSGTCKKSLQPPIPPDPFRPSFHLAVADITLTTGGDNTDPIVGAGYLYQIALRQAHPQPRPGGGWITMDLPSWYGSLGVSAAFAGKQQNLFVDGGCTYYSPGMPLSLTTIGAGVLYQRQGEEVWDIEDDEKNSDRLGPALTAGFLQNVYLRVSYGFALRGPDSGAWLLSLIYMRDLTKDLLPDRFQKYLGR